MHANYSDTDGIRFSDVFWESQRNVSCLYLFMLFVHGAVHFRCTIQNKVEIALQIMDLSMEQHFNRSVQVRT